MAKAAARPQRTAAKKTPQKTAKKRSDFWAVGKLDVPFLLLVITILTIGLVMLYGLRLFAAGKGVKLLIVLAAVLWSVLMKTQFGLCMVLLIAVYYLLKDHKAKLWISGTISLMYVTGPVSNFVLKRYNHQRGSQPNKYLFYLLYPLHLLILGVITRCITS